MIKLEKMGRTQMPIPYFDIPLNIPHAAKVAGRIVYHLQGLPKGEKALPAAVQLSELLKPYLHSEDNPSSEEAASIVAAAADLLRSVVDQIERSGCGTDRLGQAVRNLFECLQMGKEGSMQSLRAGENPDSALRPTKQ